MRQRGAFFSTLMKHALLALFLFSSLTASAATFRAGVATVDISPTEFPRIIAGGFLEGRGERLADKLFVRSFVLDDGKMKIAFAIVDTCMMEQSLIDEAKGIAAKQCGIPVDRMMVSATHTHSAPAAMGSLVAGPPAMAPSSRLPEAQLSADCPHSRS